MTQTQNLEEVKTTAKLSSKTLTEILNLVSLLKLSDFQFQNSVLAIESFFGRAVIKVEEEGDLNFSMISEKQMKLANTFAKSSETVEITMVNDGLESYHFTFLNPEGKKIGELRAIEAALSNVTDLEILKGLSKNKVKFSFEVDSSLLNKTLDSIPESLSAKIIRKKDTEEVLIKIVGDDQFEAILNCNLLEAEDNSDFEAYVITLNLKFLKNKVPTVFKVLEDDSILIEQKIGNITYLIHLYTHKDEDLDINFVD